MIPMIANVLGAAQAQRHGAFNQAKAVKENREDQRTAWLRDLGGTFLNAGLNAAMQFGGKAYDEATTGARDAQRLKSDLDQRERANVLDLAERNMDQLGYKTDPVPNAGYGMETETGKGRMGRIGPDSGPSAAEGSPITREMGPGPSAPGTLRAPTPDEAMSGLSPLQKAAQVTLEQKRAALAEAAVAQARAAAQKRADQLAKEEEAARLKSYELIGGLQTATQQRYGAKGRRANAPQFGVQPEVDERGIVRPRFTEPMKPAPMPGGGGGRQSAAEPYPGSEQIPVVAILQNKKGQPTALPRSLMNNVEWARAVTRNPEQFANVEADRPALARALRILDNPGASMDVRANTLTEINKLAAKAIETHGGTVAWAGDTMTTSPADAARQAQADAERERAAKERAAKAVSGEAERTAAIELEDIKARQAVAAIEAKAAAQMAKDASGTKREAVAGLVAPDIAAAMRGEPPRAGLAPNQVRAWQTMAARGAQIQAAKDEAIRMAKAAAAAKIRALQVPAGAAPGTVAPGPRPASQPAAVDLSTHDAIRAAVAAGKITRQQAADAFRALGEVVSE